MTRRQITKFGDSFGIVLPASMLECFNIDPEKIKSREISVSAEITPDTGLGAIFLSKIEITDNRIAEKSAQEETQDYTQDHTQEYAQDYGQEYVYNSQSYNPADCNSPGYGSIQYGATGFGSPYTKEYDSLNSNSPNDSEDKTLTTEELKKLGVL